MVLEEFQINDFLFFSVTASNLIQYMIVTET